MKSGLVNYVISSNYTLSYEFLLFEKSQITYKIIPSIIIDLTDEDSRKIISFNVIHSLKETYEIIIGCGTVKKSDCFE